MAQRDLEIRTIQFKKAFFRLTDYVLERGWCGACHATTAIMFCIAKRLGIPALACIGEARKDGIVFDHSWLEIGGEPFDIAILLPLKMHMSTGPVYCGIDLKTGLKADIEYGVSFQGLDEQASRVYSLNLYHYLKKCPSPDLIELIKNVCSSIDLYISNKWIRENLSDEYWEMI